MVEDRTVNLDGRTWRQDGFGDWQPEGDAKTVAGELLGLAMTRIATLEYQLAAAEAELRAWVAARTEREG